MYKINWKKVAQDYDGVIFDNYHNIKYSNQLMTPKYTWYDTIDINSACIWRPNSVITSWEEVK